MPTRTGSIGSNGSSSYVTLFKTPKSIGVDMATGEYPTKITLSDMKSGSTPCWYNGHYSNTLEIKLYVCDSAGNNKIKIGEWSMNPQTSDRSHKSFTVPNAQALAGKKLYLIMDNTMPSSGWDTRDYTHLRYKTEVTVQTAYNQFSVTAASNGHGTLTASANPATVGSTVTLTPNPATGYELDGYTTSPAGLTITNNKFTMPAQAVTVTATFVKKTYTVTTKASPSAGGTVTHSGTPKMGNTITLSQTPATGYYFNGWTTSPAVTVTSNSFTMPASNITVTAKYLKRSTATLNSANLTGGGTAQMTISAESSAFTHKYKLSFGTNMETGLVDVAAGVTSVSISVPESWSNYLTDAASKTGGNLTMQTYSGSTLIGTYTISGLTYNVPASAVPQIGTITASIARTISGTTYANVGGYYVQGHCGVRVQAAATGMLSATVEAMRVVIGGYSGSEYDDTVADDETDFTSGLLTIAGTVTITVMAIDSRGRISQATETITVTAYNAPAGTLSVKRVDYDGDDDDVGQYAKYAITKNYTQIGTNTLTVTMTSQGITGTISLDAGDILPGNRQTFSTQQEFIITLTLQDAFETVNVTAKLRSAKFIIYASADGNHLGLMKASNKATPAGKNATIEFSGDAAIYIGDDLLQTMISTMISTVFNQVEPLIQSYFDDVEPMIQSYLAQAMIIQEYSYSYTGLAVGDYLGISATNFGITAKQGYTIAGVVSWYTGSYHAFVYRLIARTTSTVMSIRNRGTADITDTCTATVKILWIRNDLLPAANLLMGGLLGADSANNIDEGQEEER